MQQKRCVIIRTTRHGKTSASNVVANELGYTTEFNASVLEVKNR